MCVFKSPLRANALSHTSHLYIVLYPSVNELVSFETSNMGERLVALSALERLLSSVDSHMLRQVFVFGK